MPAGARRSSGRKKGWLARQRNSSHTSARQLQALVRPRHSMNSETLPARGVRHPLLARAKNLLNRRGHLQAAYLTLESATECGGISLRQRRLLKHDTTTTTDAEAGSRRLGPEVNPVPRGRVP